MYGYTRAARIASASRRRAASPCRAQGRAGPDRAGPRGIAGGHGKSREVQLTLKSRSGCAPGGRRPTTAFSPAAGQWHPSQWRGGEGGGRG